MSNSKTYTFFLITPKRGSAKEWAKNNCETYNFDYDNEKSGNVVVAWSLSEAEDPDKELADTLTKDKIEFAMIEINDLDRFLGL